MKKTFLCLFLILSMTGFINAEEKTEEPVVKITGVIYADYVFDYSEDADFHGFELKRSYINFNVKVDDNIKLRVTPDFKWTKDNLMEAFIKFAYVDFIDPFGMGDKTTFRIGMQPTAWEGYMVSYWGFRWINRFPAGTHKFTESSDLGVSLLGTLIDDFLTYQVSYSNGEGYAGNAEKDAGKSFECMFNLHPVDSIPLNIILHGRLKELTSEVDSKDNLLAAAVYYKKSGFQVGLEYDQREMETGTSTIFSINSALNLDNILLLARYDMYDPDTETDNDVKTYILAGAGYKFNKNVQVMLDTQILTSEDDSLKDSKLLYLHWEFKY